MDHTCNPHIGIVATSSLSQGNRDASPGFWYEIWGVEVLLSKNVTLGR